jgi:hypothetical protein
VARCGLEGLECIERWQAAGHRPARREKNYGRLEKAWFACNAISACPRARFHPGEPPP